jgi:hypothetical protein
MLANDPDASLQAYTQKKPILAWRCLFCGMALYVYDLCPENRDAIKQRYC